MLNPLAVPGYDKLIQGDVLGAVLDPFIITMGFWFYALMLGSMLIGIYFKTGQLVLPVVAGLLALGVVISFMPPEVAGVAYIASSVAIAAVMYRVFKG